MRRRLLYIYLLLIAGIIACETVIVEAAPNFYFKQLSQQDGLSQNFVRSIIRLFPIQPLLYRVI